MMQWLKVLRVLMLALILGVGGVSAVCVPGCQDDNAAEEAAEGMEEAGEEAAEAGEEAAEEVEEAVE